MKKRCFNKALKWGLIVFIVFLSSLNICTKAVFADQTVNIQKRIMDKAIMQGVYNCYIGGRLVSSMDSLDKFTDIGSLMTSDAGNSEDVLLVSGSHSTGMSRLLDRGAVRYEIANDALSCKQLFVGGDKGFKLGSSANDSNAGLLEAMNKEVEAPKTNDSRTVVSFFENMGYVVENKGANVPCVSATYTYAGHTYKTNAVCKDSEGLRVEGTDHEGFNGAYFRIRDNKLCISYFDPSSRTHKEDLPCVSPRDDKWDAAHLVQAIKDICGGSLSCKAGYSFSGAESDNPETDSLANYSAHFPGIAPGAPSNTPAGNGGKAGAAEKAISFLSNNTLSAGEIGLTRPETRILYQEYLEGYYGYEINCSEGQVDSLDGKVVWFDKSSGGIKECNIAKVGSSTGTVHGVDTRGFLNKEIDKEDIIDYLNLMTEDKYTEEELSEMGSLASAERESETKLDCRSSGAGKNLTLWLCTVLELAGEAVEGAYKNVIEPALDVKSELYVSGDVSGEQTPYKAWQQFRDIANMIFVVLLLVVIFSQLTGLGIDNYGIKRILPKLIASVILINMSYLICMIAIDVSNIVGNGIKALFDGLGNGLADSVNLAGNDNGAISAQGGLMSIALVSGLAAMAGPILVASGPMVLLLLLPSVVGAFVAVFFLFFLISARQAAIVVLVAISPLAMACFVLPNTKSLFSRYLKMFEVLLLLYPTASLLMSGGDYVSKLLLQVGGSSDFSLALTAMVVGIIPIFFIPSLIKDAFAGLGKIGGTISGFGKMASGRASGAARGSDAFRAIQEKNANNLARWRAGVDKSGKVRQLSSFGKMIRGGSTIMSANRSKYQSVRNNEMLQNELNNDELFTKRIQSGDEARALKVSKEMYDGAEIGELDRDADSINSWIDEPGGEQRAAALIGSMIAQGGKKGVYRLLRNNPYLGRSNSVMNELVASGDAVLSAYGKKGRNMSYDRFMSGLGEESMAKYTGRNDISGNLDDDSMEQLLNYYGTGNKTIGVSQVLDAVTKNKDEKFLEQANTFLRLNSRELVGKVSPTQLAGISKTTIESLSGAAIDGAFVDLATNQNLSGGVDDARIEAMIERFNNTQLTNIYTNPRISELGGENRFHRLIEDAARGRGII